MTRYLVYMIDPNTHRSRIIANVSTRPKAVVITKIYPGAKIKAIGKRRKRSKKK